VIATLPTPGAAYDALHDDAALVDRTDRVRMTFGGAKAKEALGGLVTNDVAALTAGRAIRAVALTPKGRVIAVIRVIDRGDDLLVDTEAASGEGFVAMIRKFVNPRLATYKVVSEGTACVGVYGPRAAARVAAATGLSAASLSALEPLHTLPAADGAVLVLRSTDLGVPGYDLVGASDAVAALRARLDESGLPLADDDVTEIARVEAGWPRFGLDLDGETIPQEANLDQLDAISFTKGCYTGQEVVARIHFRGHVNRHLRRLVATAPLARGDAVLDASGKEVGDVRSAVVSPRRGPLAIAMVRREVEPGSEVSVRSGDTTVSARCEALA
jgi:folate-binding protein YgfZ